MKVTLNLTKLLQEGKISDSEHDKLLRLSKGETKNHAFSIIVVLAVIAVVAGTIGLFPEFFKAVGQSLLQIFGARGLHFIAMVCSGAGALIAGSGFLATLCAFITLTFVGNAGTFYSHAAYFVFIEQPGITVLIFSALAWIAYLLSLRLNAKHARVTLIFSRACVFIVNMAFWIGSLWGDREGSIKIPDIGFAIAWAVALIAVGVWAAKRDKRWVVNTSAVFGSIHFYTQWFERLGASPGSLLVAGIIALVILYGIRAYNRPYIKLKVG